MSKGQVTKWLGIAAGIWVQALAGNGNVFPHFAPTLKHQLHLNQVQLNNLGVAKDFGENVGLIAGMLCNLLPPWVILLIGALEGFLAYGTLWLVMSGLIAPLPYWQMCTVLMVGANSTTFFNTAVLVTSMRNFPNSRGTVVGIIKGFIGLSSAIFTQIYVAILMNNATNLVLLLAVGPSAVCVLVMYFIRPVTSPTDKQSADSDEHKGFFFIHIICIGLAVYLFIATFVEQFVVEITPAIFEIIIAVMLLFIISPLLVPAKFAYKKFLIRREKRRSKREVLSPSKESDDDVLREALLNPEDKQQGDSDSSLQHLANDQDDNMPQLITDPYTLYDSTKLGAESREPGKRNSSAGCLSIPRSEDGDVDPGTLLAVGEGAVRRRKGPRRGEDFTLMEAVVKADFWLLFVTFFCGIGTIITAVNNLGQIGQAQGYSDVTIFVSLYSIMNFLGRLGAGILSEHFVRSSSLPRTIWLGAAQVLMIMGHLLFASAIPGSLYVGSIVLGLCYGVHISIMVPTASELFGLRHFGMIYNFIALGNPFGSLLFSGILAGYLYDEESSKSPYLNTTTDEIILSRYLRNSVGLTDDIAACLGAHCFQLTFLIMAGVGMVGVSLTTILTYRIWRVYQALYGTPPRSTHNSDQQIPVEDGSSRTKSPAGAEPASASIVPSPGNNSVA